MDLFWKVKEGCAKKKKKIPNAQWATLPHIEQEEAVCSTYWVPAVYEHSCCVPSTTVDITRGCPVGSSYLQKQATQQTCSKQAPAGIQRLDWADVPRVERTYLPGTLGAGSMWLVLGSQGWRDEHMVWEGVCGRRGQEESETGLGNPWKQKRAAGNRYAGTWIQMKGLGFPLQWCRTMSTVKLPVGPVSVLIDLAAHGMLIEKAEKPSIPQQPKMTS